MSSLFILIPSFAIVAMIIYKAVKIRGNNKEDERKTVSLSHISYLVKEKILPKFEKVCLHTSCSFSEKAKHLHSTLKKNIHGHYSTFNDAVNGREDVGKGGAASFFLKSVAEHKKKLRSRK